MASTSWQSSYNQWGSATKFLAWTLVVVLSAGCASTHVPPMGYQGKAFRPEPDERQLWSDADKEEEKLAKLGKTYDDLLTRLRLKQAFGRLIRSQNDKGCFVVLEPATPTRLLSAFPSDTPIRRCGLKEAIREIREFLDE